VTGANVGLGYETAKHLASMNPAKLILACRSAEKGGKAAADIMKATGSSTVVCWPLDISDPASVKTFAERFERDGGSQLDILIENAGVTGFAFTRATSGWEQILATNHLGTAHLALRMLPFLLKAKEPRLVVVSSDMHYFVAEPEEADSEDVLLKLNEEEHEGNFYTLRNRYLVTKLFNVLFVRAFASHLPSRMPLTVNAVNPGFCTSALLRDVNPLIVGPSRLLARSTEVGSRTFVHAAVARELDGKTGQYLNVCEVSEASDFVISAKGASASARLWKDTIAILSEQDGQVLENVKRYLH